jgi:uridylate kinase
MKYQRILLKLSGESLMGSQNYGIEAERLQDYATQIADTVTSGVQVAIVIGGGNIYRGLKGATAGVGRLHGDYMGMLATVINSLALASALENLKVPVKLMSGMEISPVAEKAYGPKAVEYLSQGYVVFFSGGTGNPYFTTDTASALRAVEIKADAILKGTRVDGIYNEDPEKNPDAIKFETISFKEAYEKNLQVMDLTAFTLCEENKLPILVFNMNKKGNLKRVLEGENIGTLVQAD